MSFRFEPRMGRRLGIETLLLPLRYFPVIDAADFRMSRYGP